MLTSAAGCVSPQQPGDSGLTTGKGLDAVCFIATEGCARGVDVRLNPLSVTPNVFWDDSSASRDVHCVWIRVLATSSGFVTNAARAPAIAPLSHKWTQQSHTTRSRIPDPSTNSNIQRNERAFINTNLVKNAGAFCPPEGLK